jgi:hypothetical protein
MPLSPRRRVRKGNRRHIKKGAALWLSGPPMFQGIITARLL